MQRTRLDKKIIKAIRKDGQLLNKVADTLDLSPDSMARLLYGNDTRLTEYDVLAVIREHLGLKSNKKVLTGLDNKDKQIIMSEARV